MIFAGFVTGLIIMREHWRPILAISAWLILTTCLHHTTQPGLNELHDISRYLYFLPVTYAALQFGSIGGLITAVVAGLLFIPYLVLPLLFSPDALDFIHPDVPQLWVHNHEDFINDLLVILIFTCLAYITGITVDRLRQTRSQLAQSLHQLETQGAELRRAERLSALGTLAGGLAHEIRNPIGIIRATGQLIGQNDAATNSDTDMYATVIQEETERIESLVQQLLNYADSRSPSLEPVMIGALVESVQLRLQPLVDAHEIGFVVEYTPNEAKDKRANLDPMLIEQVLINLCINAIQAFEQAGTVQPLIRLCASMPNEGNSTKLQFIVKDNGPGIPIEQHTQIFDPFYTTKDKGTGLGLSVAQRIVDDHEGRMWTTSVEGQGAEFTVELSV